MMASDSAELEEWACKKMDRKSIAIIGRRSRWLQARVANSIFQYRYEPEGSGFKVTSVGGLIGLKEEV